MAIIAPGILKTAPSFLAASIGFLKALMKRVSISSCIARPPLPWSSWMSPWSILLSPGVSQESGTDSRLSVMISVISPAGPLAGYHARPFGVLRRADFPEKTALRGRHDSTKDLSAHAPRMLFNLDLRHRKSLGRVEILPPRTKCESAFRN